MTSTINSINKTVKIAKFGLEWVFVSKNVAMSAEKARDKETQFRAKRVPFPWEIVEARDKPKMEAIRTDRPDLEASTLFS